MTPAAASQGLAAWRPGRSGQPGGHGGGEQRHLDGHPAAALAPERGKAAGAVASRARVACCAVAPGTCGVRRGHDSAPLTGVPLNVRPLPAAEPPS